jgi:isopentenyldiphosphate isomerase
MASAVLEAPTTATASASRGPEAEPEEEMFEIVNEKGAVIGLERRGVVHATGLLHKAAYVWVFDTLGRLLIQQRSEEKRIGPGQWDLSVAEHLAPGE